VKNKPGTMNKCSYWTQSILSNKNFWRQDYIGMPDFLQISFITRWKVHDNMVWCLLSIRPIRYKHSHFVGSSDMKCDNVNSSSENSNIGNGGAAAIDGIRRKHGWWW